MVGQEPGSRTTVQKPRAHARDGRHLVPEIPTPWYSVVVQVLAWMVALAAFTLIVALVIVPRLVGATPYTILTGSMVPNLPPGTVVVDRPTAFSAIRNGDVVTYQLRSGESDVVTHRVIAKNVASDGALTLTTRGDANPSADALPVMAKQVRGVVWYAVPYIGYVGAFGGSDQRALAARVVGALLLLYAAWVLISAGFRRSRRRRDTKLSPEGRS
jgi:signal peptidase